MPEFNKRAVAIQIMNETPNGHDFHDIVHRLHIECREKGWDFTEEDLLDPAKNEIYRAGEAQSRTTYRWIVQNRNEKVLLDDNGVSKLRADFELSRPDPAKRRPRTKTTTSRGTPERLETIKEVARRRRMTPERATAEVERMAAEGTHMAYAE